MFCLLGAELKADLTALWLGGLVLAAGEDAGLCADAEPVQGRLRPAGLCWGSHLGEPLPRSSFCPEVLSIFEKIQYIKEMLAVADAVLVAAMHRSRSRWGVPGGVTPSPPVAEAKRWCSQIRQGPA